uniref:Uncharacterized protein n=1 Tax=Russula compacta TaxID=40490 RepID=A0A2S0U3J7_9AGAM|nr:hypothetical protein [Russula compacta]AWB36064.1 hypothetical protein [Russula compacta]
MLKNIEIMKSELDRSFDSIPEYNLNLLEIPELNIGPKVETIPTSSTSLKLETIPTSSTSPKLLESSIELGNLNRHVEENWASNNSSPKSDSTVKPVNSDSNKIHNFKYEKLFK